MFSWQRAQELAEAFTRHGVEYLFIGKGAAILLGYSDATQDVDVFPRKNEKNRQAIVQALSDLGFKLEGSQKSEIVRGKDFVQIRNGPFDVDFIFAPDGIESFEKAKKRAIVVQGLPVCHIDDIIKSKEEAGRVKDRESMARLKAFREWWRQRNPWK